MSASADFEALLRQALAPVEPPGRSRAPARRRSALTELAGDELEAWELRAMQRPAQLARAPRPAAAVVVGTGAGAGLVLLRTRGGRHKRRAAGARRSTWPSGPCATPRRGPTPVPATQRADRDPFGPRCEESGQGRDLRALADEDLMELVRRGEARAFEVVYERHGGAAFSLAYRMGHARRPRT